MTARKGNIYTGFIRSALRTYKKVWLSKITLNWEFVFLPTWQGVQICLLVIAFAANGSNDPSRQYFKK